MNDAEHVYTPPRSVGANTLPESMARYLDGTDLLHKTQAFQVSTVDADGRPHDALLSAGDAVVVSTGSLRFAVFPQSATAANLARDGRVTITLALDRGLCEVRMRAKRLGNTPIEMPLAMFEASVEDVRMHVAPYADVTSGITFRLHEPEAVRGRWERQIAALRNAG
jgi:hypothetical protein